MGLEDDFLLNDADDEKTIEFIRNYLPQELKEKFSEDELYYFLDLIDEYYSESGILDVQPDADGYVDIDLEQVVFVACMCDSLLRLDSSPPTKVHYVFSKYQVCIGVRIFT